MLNILRPEVILVLSKSCFRNLNQFSITVKFQIVSLPWAEAWFKMLGVGVMGIRGTGVAGIFPLPSLPLLAASNPSSAGPRARRLGQRAVFHGWFLCDPGLLFIGLGGCSGLILSWGFFPMENPHWKLCNERDKSACSLSPPELNPHHLLFNNYYVFCHRWFYVNIAVPFLRWPHLPPPL